jgi:hypothetical protein
MSRTDKTRPYAVKLDEATTADPYGTRREAFICWRPGLHGCADSCWQCRGSRRAENKRRRAEGRRSVREALQLR